MKVEKPNVTAEELAAATCCLDPPHPGCVREARLQLDAWDDLDEGTKRYITWVSER